MRLLKRLKPKKLNSAGIGHHALVAILVISAIAGVGAWRVWSSSAATLDSPYQRYVANQPGCELSGRVWDSTKSDCLAKCRAGTGVYKTIKGSDGVTRGFCTESVAESMNTVAEAKYCIETLKRFYIREIGCARRASQENANGAKQCIGYGTSQPYKNYVAEGSVDRCVAPTIAQTGDNTGAATATTATDPIATAICQALGRKPKDASNCYRDCRADTGTLLVYTDAAKTKYCSKSVATTIAQARCTELHRKWTPAGCARRPDQTGPDGNYAIACLSGYPWYNVNSAASNSGLDVCEKDAATAAANEKAGIVGVKADGTVVCGPGTTLSADKKTCVGTPTSTGGTTTGTGSTGGATGGNTSPVKPSSGLPTEGKYRIVLYKDKDFKGSKMNIVATLKDSKLTYKVSVDDKDLSPQPTDLTTLPKGWDNQVSSYKVVDGRWQLCPEAGFKAKTGKNPLTCVRPWASDPSMNDVSNKTKKLDNQVSSVRPVLTPQYQDPEELTDADNPGAEGGEGDVAPQCLNAAGAPVAMVEGACPAEAKLTCPAGLELQGKECKEKVLAANVIVPVDTSFKGKVGEEHCELLGREWIGKPGGGKTTNGGQYGCSLVTCSRAADGAPRQPKEGPVCVNYEYDAPYAVVLSKKTCSDLHREYIAQVKRCAQVPNRKDKDHKIVAAKQCGDKGHTVYYIFKATSKNDECFNPNYFQRAQGVAKATGGSIGKALQQGPRAYCATVKRGAYHWNGKKCVIDRKNCWDGSVALGNNKCPADTRTNCQKYGGSYCSSGAGDTGGCANARSCEGGDGSTAGDNTGSMPCPGPSCPLNSSGVLTKTPTVSCQEYNRKVEAQVPCYTGETGDVAGQKVYRCVFPSGKRFNSTRLYDVQGWDNSVSPHQLYKTQACVV